MVEQIVIFIIGLMVLIFCSGFVSAVETAYTSISDLEWKLFLNQQVNEKKRAYQCVSYMRTKYPMTVGMALLINNALAIGAGVFANQYLFLISHSAFLASSVSVVLVTLLLVFFGDFIPKNLFKKHSISFAVKTAYIVFVLWVLAAPITYWFSLLFQKKQPTKITREYLDQLTDVAYDDDVFDQHEVALVSSALELDNKLVKDFMTTNPIYAYQHDSLSDLLKLYAKHKYTRIIILDHNEAIYGVLNFKLLWSLLVDQQGRLKNAEAVKIDDAIQEPLYLSGEIKLDEALRSMQTLNTHLGIVTPTKGSYDLVGIITIEDILEELVGEIYDENDDNLDIQVINEFNYVIRPNASGMGVFNLLHLSTKPQCLNEEKCHARKLFATIFGVERLHVNKTYENDEIILKVQKDLDTQKPRYYVTRKQALD